MVALKNLITSIDSDTLHAVFLGRVKLLKPIRFAKMTDILSITEQKTTVGKSLTDDGS